MASKTFRMPLTQYTKTYAQWIDLPGMKTTFQEGKAGIQQLNASKQFSPNHTLNLAIYKVTLYEGCALSSKLLPLVIAMHERKEDESLSDFYSFDNNGICLSHGYSRYKDKKAVVEEQHDTDISRLIEHGKTIEEMIRDYPLPTPILTHITVMDLTCNSLKKQ